MARLILVAVLACVTLSERTAAQSIRGHLLEEETRVPIAQGEVTLLGQYGEVIGKTIRSDSLGAFVIEAPRGGRYGIRARRVGFAVTVTPLVFVASNEVLIVEVEMAVRAQPLLPVTIMGRAESEGRDAVSILIEGFERRKRLGLGTFWTKEQIRRRNPQTLVDLLRETPGLTFSHRGGETRIGSSSATMGPSGGVGACMPIIWVDGMRINRHNSGDHVYQAVPRGSEIEAVEIYSGRSEYPAEFGGPEARCGVVVVWTISPPTLQGRRSSPKAAAGAALVTAKPDSAVTRDSTP